MNTSLVSSVVLILSMFAKQNIFKLVRTIVERVLSDETDPEEVLSVYCCVYCCLFVFFCKLFVITNMYVMSCV